MDIDALLGVGTLAPQIKDNPQVRIDEELIVDCDIRYSIDDWGIRGSTDHPAFAELRRVLADRGLIEIPPYACVNGDRVLQPFKFNDFQLNAGDKFYCAAAWAVKIRLQKPSNAL